MKNLLLIFISATIIFASCVKFPSSNENKQVELKVPSNFDWKTFEPVKVSSASSFSVINQNGNTIARNLPAGEYNLNVGKGSILTIVPVSIATKALSKPTEGTDSRIFFPAEDMYATVMFEDFFPVSGDKDMNDLVFGLNIEYDLNSSAEVIAINFNIQPRASGGTMSYIGLAANFTGVDIKVAQIMRFSETYPEITYDHSDLAPIYDVVPQKNSYLPVNPEDDIQDYRVAPFTGNFTKYFVNPSSSYINVSNNEPAIKSYNFTVKVFLEPILPYKIFTFLGSYDSEKVNLDIFATFNYRSKEVHFKGQPWTKYFDEKFFEIANKDFTSPDDKWVWAIMSDKSIRHPLEKVKIYEAYPNFSDWFVYQDIYKWHSKFDKEKVFTLIDFKYDN